MNIEVFGPEKPKNPCCSEHKCGYPTCLAYVMKIAQGKDKFGKCPENKVRDIYEKRN